jgi:hypothetical protein
MDDNNNTNANTNDDRGRMQLRVGGEMALGGLLLLLGLVVLVNQAFDLELGEVAWPVFPIATGLGLLGLGLATPGRPGVVAAMVGGVVTMTGLVLAVQNATDRFDTWAYAWPLVFLGGAGGGRWLAGVLRGRRDLVESGGWLAAVGLVGFLGFAVVFEGLGVLGDRETNVAGGYVLGGLLIVAGLALLVRRLLGTTRR